MHRPAMVRSLLVATSLLISFDAAAATLVTGGILGRRHRCCIVNAGTKPLVEVAPELRAFDGTSAGGSNRSLPCSSRSTTSQRRHCRTLMSSTALSAAPAGEDMIADALGGDTIADATQAR